jgi:hypothetical protein
MESMSQSETPPKNKYKKYLFQLEFPIELFISLVIFPAFFSSAYKKKCRKSKVPKI